MLIYAVADIHGRQSKIGMTRRNIDQYKPDLLIIAGDLTRWFNPRPTIERIADLSIETVLVRGNTDRKQIENILADFPTISSLHRTTLEICGHTFAGIGGTIPIPFRSQISLTESWSRSMGPLLKTGTILIGHPPPRGTLDAVFLHFHAGCPKMREVILNHSPLLYICGHIHESSGKQQLGNTLIVNCSIGDSGEGALITLREDGSMKVDMLQQQN